MQKFEEPIDENTLQEIYAWVDQIPLSRPKKNFARDFSDGAMVAEVVAHYFPKIVEVHNYPACGSVKLKVDNWIVLNRKVLRKLQFEVAEDVIQDIAACKPFVIERVLIQLRERIDAILWQQHQQNTQMDGPESDQYRPPPKPVKIRKAPIIEPQSTQSKASSGSNSHLTRVEKKKKPAEPLPTPSVVPIWQYKSLENESRAKDETIEILQAKINKMDQLLQLKDLRIDELQTSQQKMRQKAKGRGKPGMK